MDNILDREILRLEGNFEYYSVVADELDSAGRLEEALVLRKRVMAEAIKKDYDNRDLRLEYAALCENYGHNFEGELIREAINNNGITTDDEYEHRIKLKSEICKGSGFEQHYSPGVENWIHFYLGLARSISVEISDWTLDFARATIDRFPTLVACRTRGTNQLLNPVNDYWVSTGVPLEINLLLSGGFIDYFGIRRYSTRRLARIALSDAMIKYGQ